MFLSAATDGAPIQSTSTVAQRTRYHCTKLLTVGLEDMKSNPVAMEEGVEPESSVSTRAASVPGIDVTRSQAVARIADRRIAY